MIDVRVGQRAAMRKGSLVQEIAERGRCSAWVFITDTKPAQLVPQVRAKE